VGVQVRHTVVNSVHHLKHDCELELLAAGVLMHYDEGRRKIIPWTNIIYADLVPEKVDELAQKAKLAKAN
jgi:hypothetical protein